MRPPSHLCQLFEKLKIGLCLHAQSPCLVGAAETAKAGLWSGSFVKPWDWRLGEVQAAQKAHECAIKGNINREGERIYHLPFQQFYPKTKIDKSRGERWFCTEQEAVEAGWRRSLR